MNSFIELFRNGWLYPVILFCWLLGWWILDKIFPAFLKSYYDTRLELQKRDFLRRDKAAVIAELIVLLRSTATDDPYKDKIDKCLLELSLYLPPCLVHKLSHTVCRSGTAEDLKPLGLFIEIRSYMEGTYTVDTSKKLVVNNIALTERHGEPVTPDNGTT